MTRRRCEREKKKKKTNRDDLTQQNNTNSDGKTSVQLDLSVVKTIINWTPIILGAAQVQREDERDLENNVPVKPMAVVRYRCL